MKIIVTVKEVDFEDSVYSTKEWAQSVNIKRWEHNFEESKYVIEYESTS